jgi:hypothetical protein
MSRKQKRILWPVLIAIALGIVGFAFASKRAGTTELKLPPAIEAGSLQPLRRNPPPVAASADNRHVHLASVSPQLRWNLNEMGDRLNKPGKERLAITGTLVRADEAQPLNVLLVLEYPDRLRMTLQRSGQSRVLTFDGQTARAAGNELSAVERDLIEMLVYDNADHFFSTQMLGKATRFFGSRFRTEGAAANAPAYDIYEVSDQIDTSAQRRQQSRRYYFNSSTLLMEGVRYEIERNGSEVSVEIRIRGWQRVGGQALPGRIIRLENNQPVLTLTISSIALSPRADDGIFGN